MLIDGRFRIALALAALPYLHDESAMVFIHDFWSTTVNSIPDNLPTIRDLIEKYYDIIGHTRNLAAWRRKPVKSLPANWRTVGIGLDDEYVKIW